MKKKSLIIIILLFILIVALIITVKFKKDSSNQNIAIEKYSGNDIKFEVTSNRMPQAFDENVVLPKNYFNYGGVRISSSFISKNNILSMEYLYDKDTYMEYDLRNKDLRNLRIDGIYIDKNNQSSIRLLVENKNTHRMRKLELTADVQEVW